MIHRIQQAQLDDARGDLAHRPARAALGGIAAGDHTDLSLQVAGDLGSPPRSGFLHQSRLDSFLEAAFAHVGDGGAATQERLGDLGIGTSLSGAAIGEQEDAGTGLDSCGSIAALNDGLEFLALLEREVKGNMDVRTPSIPDSRQS